MTCAMAPLLIMVASLLLAAGTPAVAQTPAAPAVTEAAPPILIPGYWDPRRRTDRVDLTRVPQIRFLTDDELPPFGFPGPDGRPRGSMSISPAPFARSSRSPAPSRRGGSTCSPRASTAMPAMR